MNHEVSKKSPSASDRSRNGKTPELHGDPGPLWFRAGNDEAKIEMDGTLSMRSARCA